MSSGGEVGWFCLAGLDTLKPLKRRFVVLGGFAWGGGGGSWVCDAWVCR